MDQLLRLALLAGGPTADLEQCRREHVRRLELGYLCQPALPCLHRVPHNPLGVRGLYCLCQQVCSIHSTSRNNFRFDRRRRYHYRSGGNAEATREQSLCMGFFRREQCYRVVRGRRFPAGRSQWCLHDRDS